MLYRIKENTGDITTLHSELLDLCGAQMLDIIAAVINSRDYLTAEFKVCDVLWY
jgi:hypothetical protein